MIDGHRVSLLDMGNYARHHGLFTRAKMEFSRDEALVPQRGLGKLERPGLVHVLVEIEEIPDLFSCDGGKNLPVWKHLSV
ncbi:MAG TPA: hypothetical protein VMW46_11990 [Candidatus Desulfaltia sp.]|nr:hypothetical protein [Candidatus Desulfaltia sp.]